MKKDATRLLFFGVALLFAVSLAQGQISSPGYTLLIIPQIVDGGPWLTTIALSNTSANPAGVNLRFYQESSDDGSTQPWSLNFLEMPGAQTQIVTVPAATTLFLHTLDTASSTTIGWGQLEQSGNAPVAAYAIFTQRSEGPVQKGTAPAALAISRILVPFDNTSGAVTTMAIANPTLSSESIFVGIRTAAGTTQPPAITLPAEGHASFSFPAQFTASAGQSGMAEFYSATGIFSILALEFQSGAFTTAPVYPATGPPIIASPSGGPANIIVAEFTVSKYNGFNGSFSTTSPTTDAISGQFASYTPAEWQLPFSAQPFGPCSVLNVTYPVTTYGSNEPYAADGDLDAGTISANGQNLPSGFTLSDVPFPNGGMYIFVPPNGTTLPLGATYTISSKGGTQVGPFSISATLPTSFAVTNWDAITSINRANSLTLNWTGSGFNTVTIEVLNIQTDSAISAINEVTVSCTAPASAGALTIPPDALAELPTGTGLLKVSATTSSSATSTPVSSTAQTLVPSLVGGGQVNYGSFTPSLVLQKFPTIL